MREGWDQGTWDRYGTYAVGTLALAAGMALMPTGIGSPLGFILAGIGGGALTGAGGSIILQEFLTGDVDWSRVGTDALVGAALGPLGKGGLANARYPTSGLVHLTRQESAQLIRQEGILRGPIGIWALSDDIARQPTWLRYARTGGNNPSKLEAMVEIPPEALPYFRRPLPIGPYSTYQYLARMYRAPAGSIDLRTGQYLPAGGRLHDLRVRGVGHNPYLGDIALHVAAGSYVVSERMLSD